MSERISPEEQQREFAIKLVEDWKAFSDTRAQSRIARRRNISISAYRMASKRNSKQELVDKFEKLQEAMKEEFAQATQALDKDFTSGIELFNQVNWQSIQKLSTYYDSPQEFLEGFDSGIFTLTRHKTRRQAHTMGIGDPEVAFLRMAVKEAAVRNPQPNQ